MRRCTSVVMPTGVKGKDWEKSESSLPDPEGLLSLWATFRTGSVGMWGLPVTEELRLDYAIKEVSSSIWKALVAYDQ